MKYKPPGRTQDHGGDAWNLWQCTEIDERRRNPVHGRLLFEHPAAARATGVNSASMPPWPARPALFLDVDGTLIEIADDPESVVVPNRLKVLFEKLASATDGAIALISGRPIEQIDRLLAPSRLPIAGVHGLERRAADGRLTQQAQFRDLLDPLRGPLTAFVHDHPGLLLEDKHFGFALHYRRRPELQTLVQQFVDGLGSRLPDGLGLLRGRMVVEIKPDGTDKGKALQAFMREPPFAGRTPVFIGDDVTDEAGFATVNALGGVSVKVGAGASAAHCRLTGVDAVLDWLECVGETGVTVPA